MALAQTHDAAFDAGLITFDEQCRLVLSRELRDYLPDRAFEREFKAFEGKPMLLAEGPSFIIAVNRCRIRG